MKNEPETLAPPMRNLLLLPLGGLLMALCVVCGSRTDATATPAPPAPLVLTGTIDVHSPVTGDLSRGFQVEPNDEGIYGVQFEWHRVLLPPQRMNRPHLIIASVEPGSTADGYYAEVSELGGKRPYEHLFKDARALSVPAWYGDNHSISVPCYEAADAFYIPFRVTWRDNDGEPVRTCYLTYGRYRIIVSAL